MSLCSELPDDGHYMITGRHDEIRYTSLAKMRDSQLVYIIHLATEMLFVNLKHPIWFESQKSPQDDYT